MTRYRFTSSAAAPETFQHNGRVGTIEQLDESKYDRQETGQMWTVTFPDGETVDAFEDELSEIPEGDPSEIVATVFKRWQKQVTPAWADGTYTPSDNQFAEMAIEAIEADRAQRDDAAGPSRTLFQVGALVQLTGASWSRYNLRHKIARLAVESGGEDGPVNTFKLDGKTYAVFKNEHDDFSASAIVGVNER